jgi:hypothetical protein
MVVMTRCPGSRKYISDVGTYNCKPKQDRNITNGHRLSLRIDKVSINRWFSKSCRRLFFLKVCCFLCYSVHSYYESALLSSHHQTKSYKANNLRTCCSSRPSHNHMYRFQRYCFGCCQACTTMQSEVQDVKRSIGTM